MMVLPGMAAIWRSLASSDGPVWNAGDLAVLMGTLFTK
jgi:hypothetical protein